MGPGLGGHPMVTIQARKPAAYAGGRAGRHRPDRARPRRPHRSQRRWPPLIDEPGAAQGRPGAIGSWATTSPGRRLFDKKMRSRPVEREWAPTEVGARNDNPVRRGKCPGRTSLPHVSQDTSTGKSTTPVVRRTTVLRDIEKESDMSRQKKSRVTLTQKKRAVSRPKLPAERRIPWLRFLQASALILRIALDVYLLNEAWRASDVVTHTPPRLQEPATAIHNVWVRVIKLLFDPTGSSGQQ